MSRQAEASTGRTYELVPVPKRWARVQVPLRLNIRSLNTLRMSAGTCPIRAAWMLDQE
jgi:hypothetical protein